MTKSRVVPTSCTVDAACLAAAALVLTGSALVTTALAGFTLEGARSTIRALGTAGRVRESPSLTVFASDGSCLAVVLTDGTGIA